MHAIYKKEKKKKQIFECDAREYDCVGIFGCAIRKVK